MTILFHMEDRWRRASDVQRYCQQSCKRQFTLLTHLGRVDKGCPCRASCALNILGQCIT